MDWLDISSRDQDNSESRSSSSFGEDEKSFFFSGPDKRQSFSGSATFFPKNPAKLCSWLHWVLQEKQNRVDANSFDDETVAVHDKFWDYICENPTQHKIT